jgi:hypothetical protein
MLIINAYSETDRIIEKFQFLKSNSKCRKDFYVVDKITNCEISNRKKNKKKLVRYLLKTFTGPGRNFSPVPVPVKNKILVPVPGPLCRSLLLGHPVYFKHATPTPTASRWFVKNA